MQSWVRDFLRSIRDEETISAESLERELESPVFVWQRLAGLFLHWFDSDGMVRLLGSVLCQLPESDFNKILAAYPFFILVKSAGLCQKLHAAGDVPLIVFVQSELAQMNWSHRQAVVAHEIAHITLNHLGRPFSLDDPWRDKQQVEADDQVRQWGFDIDGVRKFLNERSR